MALNKLYFIMGQYGGKSMLPDNFLWDSNVEFFRHCLCIFRRKAKGYS
jgi:hypothetical protein